MRIAIVGSRDFPDAYVRVSKCLRRLKNLYGDGIIIVTGGGGRIDNAAITLSIDLGLRLIVIPAKWEKEGKRAGILRNTKIVQNSDEVYAFWDGKSKGTADTIRKAQIANKPVYIRRIK